MIRLAYNTNGLAHHRLVDAIALLAELGYVGVAITPDVGQLDLYRLDPREVEEVRSRAADAGLALAVETGARYLMDARRKHRPTLLEDEPLERERRVDFLRRSIDLAVALGAEVCSFWSGAGPEPGSTRSALGRAEAAAADRRAEEAEALWGRLVEGVGAVLTHARASGVRLAFEPEPGMFVERTAGFFELRRRLGGLGADLTLCLDVGHCLCTGEAPPEQVIRETASCLGHVHLDDIRGGVHEHRMFGEGDLDLTATLLALESIRFPGLAAVELSRDSHRGAAAAEQALQRLRAAGR